MQMPTIVAIRANLILFALAVAMSDAACLLIAALFGKLDSMSQPFPRIAALAGGAILMTLVRRRARKAFEAAQTARGLTRNAHDQPDIDHDWLAQLHVELHQSIGPRNAAAKR